MVPRYQEYLQAVDAAQLAHPEWRWGQVHFNVLQEIDPDLAEEVRGGELDPYHRDDRADWLCAHVSIIWGRRYRASSQD